MTVQDFVHPSTLRRTSAESLRGLCGGAVYLPGDPGFDDARTAWNVAVDQRPAAVAYPANADRDVAARAGPRWRPGCGSRRRAPGTTPARWAGSTTS